MRLSWNELRARAADFAREHAGDRLEKSDAQTFYNEFFAIFEIKRRSVARYEEHVEKLDTSGGYIDLFWPSVLLVEQKSSGRSLDAARAQAFEYFDALAEHERPRYLLLCDFQNWELTDLDLDDHVRFTLAELPEQIERFGFMMGVHRRAFREQDPVNMQASELIGAIHDGLRESGYDGEDLDRFLVRIVFCLFADNTGIFERESFLAFLEGRTKPDGSNTGLWVNHLFQVLNTPEDRRSRHLDQDLAAFPFIDGDLFAETILAADFDSALRRLLIEAARFDWSRISPAIFGALFQSVMDPDHRRAVGAHYTTEQNILKVIEPLFLDDLRAEFERIRSQRGGRRRANLLRFQQRLGKMRFLDPACGCGNFLIITYRELRELEIEVLLEIHGAERQAVQDVSALSTMNVDQFCGIEILEFPARIAETALWMMDHIMNRRLGEAFGQYYARIPLQTSPQIRCADAHEIDWNDVVPAEQCTYVYGNPPFVGSKMQSVLQREQVQRAASLEGGGTLDYVAAWFIVAGEYAQQGSAKIAFVATNSISQGEQVGQLWPILYDRCQLEIAFAHRTFEWGSEARGKAHVHVVIVGLDKASAAPPQKRLFSYRTVRDDPEESGHALITPLLVSGEQLSDPKLVVREQSRPLNGMPQLIIGSKPIDNGHYILDAEERAALLAETPEVEPYVRPFVGAREFLQGSRRWILRLDGAPPSLIQSNISLRDRVRAVREFRSNSRSRPTQTLAATPLLYHVNVIPDAPFLAIPKTSSERREYLPVAWLEPPIIPSDALFVLRGTELWQFALLNSALHNAWLRTVAGRLKSDYRYSIGVVYNTFPVPATTKRQRDRLTELAQAVLDARAAHPEATLADLYDPDVMPADLRRAHAVLDRYVDRVYRPRVGFDSERERVEHLLARYEQMVSPLDAAQPRRRGRRRRT